MAGTILIADDEVHIRLLLEQSLEELEDSGVEIQTVADGEEALVFIQSEHPNLVILDVMMPKMSGFDVCERIKKDPALATTHVILLTAKGQEYDRQRGAEVAADNYMTKPFDPDLLLSMARDILGIDDG
jgi:DNA-binding response OmpR family regulator